MHDSLPSTADLIAARAAGGEAEGLAVLARRQTAGRGRQGRSWVGIEGNLFLSVLLRPETMLREAPQWSLLAGVALVDAVLPLLPDPSRLRLKWPNDLLLGGAKLAGILVESSAGPEGRLAWLNLGFGVNLADAPPLPDRPVTSLAAAGIAPPAPEAFAPRLLAMLDRWRRVPAAEGFAPVRAAWLRHGPPLGSAISVRQADGIRSGHFAGLDGDGRLLLEASGRLLALSAGEVAAGEIAAPGG
nr:biotin--[acetyl-CoA-carboxylase] ligase [Roseomonas acroporae]